MWGTAPRRWIGSTLIAACFTALTVLVLSYSPAGAVATAGELYDCVVGPQSQEEGWCCHCPYGEETLSGDGAGECFKHNYEEQDLGNGVEACNDSLWCEGSCGGAN